MSVIVPDDPTEPACTTDGKDHEWHVNCAYCGMPGYHDDRSEEIAAWGRLRAENYRLYDALSRVKDICTDEPDAVKAATVSATLAERVLADAVKPPQKRASTAHDKEG